MDLKLSFNPMIGTSGSSLGFKGTWSADQEVWPKDHLEIGWPLGGLDFSAPSPPLRKPEQPPAPKPSSWLHPLNSTQKSGPTQVALPRRQVSQLLTVAASLRRVADTLSPDTRRILDRVEVPAVLGARPKTPLT